MDKIIETEGIGGRPLLCDHTGVSSKESQKHLTAPTSLEMLKNPCFEKNGPGEGIENVHQNRERRL